jgi:hypothetical protein
MKLKISENILNDTTRCRKNFVCLSERDCLCEIKYCFDGKSFVIKPDKNIICPYKVSMVTLMLCSCPTRKEIYKRYNI